MKKKQQQPIHTPARVSDEQIEQTLAVLREVCSLASAAMGISRDQVEGGHDADDLHSRIRVLDLLVDRIGWVADVGLRKLGEPGSLARAEDWMLPGI